MIIGYDTHFDACHFLPNHPKCGKMHGHTWHVSVQAQGPIDLATGMVCDFHKFKQLVAEVVDTFDHCSINEFVSPPTCENIAQYIYDLMEMKLLDQLPNLNLAAVTVQEGEGGYAIA